MRKVDALGRFSCSVVLADLAVGERRWKFEEGVDEERLPVCEVS